MSLGPRARLALKIGGYALLALIVFVYAVHLTFPYHRVRDKLIESLSGKYDVTVSGVDRSLVPGRFALTGVTLASRPAAVGQPITTMYFKRVEVDLKILPLLSSRMVAGLDVSVGNGSIAGTVEQDGTTTIANFTLERVPLATLPGISDAVGLPMDGNADGKLSLRLPAGDWTKAAGKLDLSCRVNCAVGDGVTKIYPKPTRPADAALYRDGLTVPRIEIERFALGVDLGKSVASLRSFDLVSADGKVEVDFDIRLARQLGSSTINGCIRYQCAADFQRKYPGLCVGSPIVDEQGMLNIKLSGQVSRMRRLPQRCDTNGSAGDSAGGMPSRPTLDAIPEPTVTPPTPVTPTPVTPTPVTPSPGAAAPMPPPPEPPPLTGKTMADDVNGSIPPPAIAPTGIRGGGVAPSVPSDGSGSVAPPPVEPTQPYPSPGGYTGSGAYSPGHSPGGSYPPGGTTPPPPSEEAYPSDSARPQ